MWVIGHGSLMLPWEPFAFLYNPACFCWLAGQQQPAVVAQDPMMGSFRASPRLGGSRRPAPLELRSLQSVNLAMGALARE